MVSQIVRCRILFWLKQNQGRDAAQIAKHTSEVKWHGLRLGVNSVDLVVTTQIDEEYLIFT